MGDEDPLVRIAAVENVVTDEAGLALLREATMDPDATVRAIADERLSEHAAQSGGH